MRTHRPLCSLILILATALAGAARAQPAPEPPPTTTAAAAERARKLFVEAVRLYDDGKYPQAYVAFAAAWAIKKHPSIAGNLADCEVKVGKLRDAAEHYRYVLKDTTGEAKADDKRRATERLADVTKRIGVITFNVSPRGATLVLDGVPLGEAPVSDSVFVDPGQHTLEGRADGYVSAAITFDARAGAALPVQLDLAAKRVDPPVQPPPDRRPRLALTIVSGVLAAGGIAAGAGLTVAANSKGSSADGLRATLPSNSSCYGSGAAAPTCKSLNDALGAESTLSKGALAGFVLGGAFAAATVGLGLWSRPSSDQGEQRKGRAQLQVVPVIAGREGGVVVMGRW